MKSIRARRGPLALAAAALVAAAGGIAYAAIPDGGGVYHACMKKNGTIRIIDTDLQSCNARSEVAISFAKEGPQGDPGPPGPPGPPGADGEDGADGEPFSGTFTSPNGVYSLSVTDAGIVLAGAGSRVSLDATGIEVRSASDLELLGGANVRVESSGNATVRAGATLSHFGAIVRLNSIGGCTGAARVGDQVSGTAAPTGVVSGFILTGAPTVCVG